MKRITLVLILLLLTITPVYAQGLPWVEIWVTVRDGYTGALIADAQVEIPQCAGLPADSCTRYGVWDAGRQAFILKVPRSSRMIWSSAAAGMGRRCAVARRWMR